MGAGSEMVKEKWLQLVIDIVRERGCVTRRFIVDELQSLSITQNQAERIADETLESLLKRGVIVRKGRGVYCWSP